MNMESKIKKRIKKEILKILPKDEIYSSEIQEIKSQIEQIKLQGDRRSSTTHSQHDVSNCVYEGESSEFRNDFDNKMCNVDVRNDSTGENLTLQEPVKDLCKDFYSILEKGYFTDISINCGSEVLHAHKAILCARSPVFEAMFTSSMQESQTDTVVIDDIDPSTMTIMFTFLYSGQIKELSLSTASDLLYAAEKYQIVGLKKICIQYLTSSLSTQNVFQILQCADLYDEELKARVMSFIHTNFSYLKSTDEWNELQSNHPSLAFEVYSYVVDRFQEKERNQTVMKC